MSAVEVFTGRSDRAAFGAGVEVARFSAAPENSPPFEFADDVQAPERIRDDMVEDAAPASVPLSAHLGRL